MDRTTGSKEDKGGEERILAGGEFSSFLCWYIDIIENILKRRSSWFFFLSDTPEWVREGDWQISMETSIS